MHKEDARDIAVKIVDTNIKFTGLDGKPEVNYDRLISDVMDALIEASRVKVVTKEAPPFVFDFD
jgi:hypothetical protein